MLCPSGGRRLRRGRNVVEDALRRAQHALAGGVEYHPFPQPKEQPEPEPLFDVPQLMADRGLRQVQSPDAARVTLPEAATAATIRRCLISRSIIEVCRLKTIHQSNEKNELHCSSRNP